MPFAPVAPKPKSPSHGKIILLAGLLLMITMGIRQTVGLFVQPIEQSSGMDIVSISFALAVGQFMWGFAQPFFGAIADKRGSYGVLVVGALLMSLGQIATVWAVAPWQLMLTLGFLSPAGAAAGSFSVLIGATAAQLDPAKRSIASGIINAGGSVGQFVFAPLVQVLLSVWGLGAALVSLGVAALATIPLARWLCPAGSRPGSKLGSKPGPMAPKYSSDSADAAVRSVPGGFKTAAPAKKPLREQVTQALKDPSYLLLHAGFFTCGFHVAFLITHLPGEVALSGHSAHVSAMSLSLIGLCNIAGSLIAGALGNRFQMKYILAFIYASRAVMIAIYLVSPKTELTFYVFAAAIGFTWLATVPPTAGIVGKLFGVSYLATLFGLTLFTHQIGAFLGAWLGGLAVAHEGSYLWVWYADIALALLAALVNLPIRENRPSNWSGTNSA